MKKYLPWVFWLIVIFLLALNAKQTNKLVEKSTNINHK